MADTSSYNCYVFMFNSFKYFVENAMAGQIDYSKIILNVYIYIFIYKSLNLAVSDHFQGISNGTAFKLISTEFKISTGFIENRKVDYFFLVLTILEIKIIWVS